MNVVRSSRFVKHPLRSVRRYPTVARGSGSPGTASVLGRRTHDRHLPFSQDDPEIRPAAARGHYRATAGETPHRWFYDITRVTPRVWRVAQLRLQHGWGLIVVDTRDVATLKAGMRWCEDANSE